MNQCEQILDYMKRFGSISTMEAFTDLDITRLNSRIHDLRKEYEIEDKWEKRKNRLGQVKHYKRYYLAKEE